ncbi:MAG: cobalamin-binding protein [Proteobacteria bacterium]|nr:cobalamin-binding protein [Pseudomonadota bacterium]
MTKAAGSRRIVSFLPSATEMVYALGLGDRLMGITHECDYPPAATTKPVVVRNVLPIDRMSQPEIDVAVTERLRDGLSLYQVDEALVRDIAPDLILTQNLCQVCAPSGNEVTQLVKSLASNPRILWLTPKSLDQIFDNVRELGEATDRLSRAEALIAAGRARLEEIATATRDLCERPRVFCMEWMDPVYCCGHWVPEMVRIAGGRDELGRDGTDSVRIPWSEVLRWAPEVLIVMPCGFHMEKAAEQAQRLFAYPGWSDLPAVRTGRVFAVDANSYFARPGPRVVEGTELLAHLLHPARFDWKGPQGAFRQLLPVSSSARGSRVPAATG